MPEFDVSRVLAVDADRVWRVVSDPDRVGEWVPTVHSTTPAATGEVHLEGESHGHPYALTAPLRVEEENRRLQWSSDRHQGYVGWLQVRAVDQQAEVHLHLTVPVDRVEPTAGGDEVRRGMNEALDRLQALAG